MAEAAVENPEPAQNNKYYCHQCTTEIQPKLPDFTCPQCDSGFIEELTEELNSTTNSTATTPQAAPDPAAHFAELWGRAFLESFRAAERDEGVAWARDRDSDDDETETTRRQQRAFQPPRVSFRRTRPIRNQYLQGLFQFFSDRIETEMGGGGPMAGLNMPGIPINIVPLHGNPEDYAWGASGLDSIITQLLNQLEGSGAPPAQKEKIDNLPTVNITQQQVENVLQCSVCMEEFKLEESVNRLPCDHHYHKECIVTWLKMHGTCPVCRKDLNGEDTSLKDDMNHMMEGGGSIDLDTL